MCLLWLQGVQGSAEHSYSGTVQQPGATEPPGGAPTAGADQKVVSLAAQQPATNTAQPTPAGAGASSGSGVSSSAVPAVVSQAADTNAAAEGGGWAGLQMSYNFVLG